MKLRLIAAIWISVFWSEVGALTSLYNVTAQRNVERSKRFIIFDGYGILMFISGVALPVILEDKKPWRSVGAVYSLHGQFAQPEEPLYWWDKWEGRSLAEAKRQFNRDGTYIPDESRAFIYALLEHYMNKAGKNGRKCMLRAICEHARVDEVEGIVGEIIHAVLRPADDSDEEYRDAFKAGRYGAICTTMYPECPRGKGLLDNVIVSKLKQFYKDM